MSEEYLVSVIMLTYNHEKYIEEAIKGVLNQKTTFSYQLIIGEDCSTDRTREIIEKYARRYPEIIKCIFHNHNVGARKNGMSIAKIAKSKYWAFCEGDDYWCDEKKLQMQVEFLENNQEYSAVYHNVKCVDYRGKVGKTRQINKYPIVKEQDYDFYKIRDNDLPGQTASLVARNLYRLMNSKRKIRNFNNCPVNGDEKVALVLSCYGKIKVFSQIMAIHRVVLRGDSWSASASRKNLLKYQYEAYLGIKCLMRKDYGRDYSREKYEAEILKESIRCFRENTNFDNFIILIFVVGYHITEKIRERFLY